MRITTRMQYLPKVTPQTMTRRYDGEYVDGTRRVYGIFTLEDDLFPLAYEEHDTGPYLEETLPRSRYAHYHPLADCQQLQVNYL